MTGQNSTVTVSQTVSKNSGQHEAQKGGRPAHWVNDAGTSFWNPWESYRHHTFPELLSFLLKYPSMTYKDTSEIAQCLSVRKPTWGESRSESEQNDTHENRMKATWLGHACFLVEFPSRAIVDPTSSQESIRGVRILFDPVFSERCFSNQYMGPKRYTPAPCTIEEIPEVDAVVISHNHYDHLDTHTIRTLFHRTKRTPHFFAPLGNLSFFQKLGIPDSNIHTMDWWDSKRLEVSFGDTVEHAVNTSTESNKTNDTDFRNNKRVQTVDITCTPSQHFTGRSLWDHFKTLWASWVVEEVRVVDQHHDATTAPRSPMKVYFAGDTAYRTVLAGEDEDKVPFCPAFQEVGKKFGGFDFAMIPIGAYMPREFTSRVHCAPQDSVRLFKDIRAKKAIGMHWGTWVLTTEDVADPPRRLAEERRKLGIEDDAFSICDIGETVFL